MNFPKPRPRLRAALALRACGMCAVALVTSLVSPAGAKTVEFTLRALPDQMKYDQAEFVVAPGDEVRLTFRNDDRMPHNVVVCLPRAPAAPGAAPEDDRGFEVAKAAWDLGADAVARDWVPAHPRVLAASKMLAGGAVETLRFIAPAAPGSYPYVCTFPGHATMMFGAMQVRAATPVFQALKYRLYRGPFSALPDFAALSDRVVREATLPDGLLDASMGDGKGSFAIEFEGVLRVPKTGAYTFVVAGNHGPTLHIDGTLVADARSAPTGAVGAEAKAQLEAGDRRVVVRYWHRWERQRPEPAVTLLWSGPDFKDAPLSRVDLVARARRLQAEGDAGMPLAPANNEPVFYRNFVADMRSGFAIGYPGGANVTWDPATFSVGTVWAGEFLDVKRHRTRTGAGTIKPAGTGVARAAPGAPLAVLDQPDAKWPAGKVAGPGYRFTGYTFDAQKRPTFRYHFGNLAVSDTFAAEGSARTGDLRLVRTVRIQPAQNAGEAVPGLMFRILAAADLEAQPAGVLWDKVVRVTTNQSEAITRSSGALKELLVPIRFRDGVAVVEIFYAWTNSEARHAH